MKLSVLTIFPELFDRFWDNGMIRQAVAGGQIVPHTLNIRDFAAGKHRVTDDRPYGGGCGMVMKPEPLAGALKAAMDAAPSSKRILLSPQGRLFDQQTAGELAKEEGLIFICGRYEGVDERVYSRFVDFEISIGDFVLTGGEIAAMVVMDAVIRLIPGVLGNEDSAGNDSFSDDLLEHAQYTRPRVFEGDAVPDVLLSGNHVKIEKWRMENALIRTFLKRRDLLDARGISKAEAEILKRWQKDIEDIIRTGSLRGADSLSSG